MAGRRRDFVLRLRLAKPDQRRTNLTALAPWPEVGAHAPPPPPAAFAPAFGPPSDASPNGAGTVQRCTRMHLQMHASAPAPLRCGARPWLATACRPPVRGARPPLLVGPEPPIPPWAFYRPGQRKKGQATNSITHGKDRMRVVEVSWQCGRRCSRARARGRSRAFERGTGERSEATRRAVCRWRGVPRQALEESAWPWLPRHAPGTASAAGAGMGGYSCRIADGRVLMPYCCMRQSPPSSKVAGHQSARLPGQVGLSCKWIGGSLQAAAGRRGGCGPVPVARALHSG